LRGFFDAAHGRLGRVATFETVGACAQDANGMGGLEPTDAAL